MEVDISGHRKTRRMQLYARFLKVSSSFHVASKGIALLHIISPPPVAVGAFPTGVLGSTMQMILTPIKAVELYSHTPNRINQKNSQNDDDGKPETFLDLFRLPWVIQYPEIRETGPAKCTLVL